MSLAQDDLESRVTRIEDLESIKRLIQENRIFLDAWDFVGYSQLFAGSGSLLSNGKRATGPGEILTLLDRREKENAPDPGPTRYHAVWEPVIELDGDTATAMTNWGHVTRGPDNSPTLTTYGHYDDAFTKASGRWLFQSREIHMYIPYRSASGATDPGPPVWPNRS